MAQQRFAEDIANEESPNWNDLVRVKITFDNQRIKIKGCQTAKEDGSCGLFEFL